MIGHNETGNETYVANLIKGLSQIDFINSYTIIVDKLYHKNKLKLNSNFEISRIWPANSFFRIPFSMPIKSLQNKLDLLHVTYVAPPLSPCPFVVSVHDISFKLFPETFLPRDRIMLSILVPFTMRRAKKIITLSNASKKDIIDQFGISENKIEVIYLAASEIFQTDFSIKTDDKICSFTDKPYILAVGNIQPRKNLRRLLEAYVKFSKAEDFDLDLLLVGPQKWASKELESFIDKANLSNRIHLTGYVPENDLLKLYRYAKVFVYPSLYEGFGLPVIEAMSCNTPVVASNIPVMKEIADGAAVLIDPYNSDDIASGIRKIISNPAFADDLRKRGLKRASNFSWLETAKQTLSVYESCLLKGGV